MNKNILRYFILSYFSLFIGGCNTLDLEPLDKISVNNALSSDAGVNAMLATLYRQLPVEDFVYNKGGTPAFNYYKEQWGGINGNIFTDDVISQNSLGNLSNANINVWTELYVTIRQTNQFLESIKSANIDTNQKTLLKSEAHFIRAYCYFQLVRRFGGVPIIFNAQKFNAGGDNSDVFVPRSTEKETWNFVLADCDSAAIGLPSSITSSVYGPNRATKWAAYGLKSRAALHAASVAKYWDKDPLAGDAVSQKLVGGMNISDANNYYKQCIDASKAIIDNSGKSLYKPNPTNPQEAALNYQTIFKSPRTADCEVIFSKAYISGLTASNNGQWMDWFNNPNQVNGYSQRGKFNPTLDLADVYEDYTDNGIGASVPFTTRIDGNESDYSGYNKAIKYKHYANVLDVFAQKDARLSASMIIPGSMFAGVKINIQAGLISPDGSPKLLVSGSAVKNGITYYTFGDASEVNYSGFKFTLSNTVANNFTLTGFSLRKFLMEAPAVGANASTTPFIDIRLAEIYLNYAEAVVESGQGDMNLAKNYLNAIRHRAAHTDNIPATIGNILKERRVELAFEGGRYWDLVRRRDLISVLDGSKRKALMPILDLSQTIPDYIFVRAINQAEILGAGRKVEPENYYYAIPGITSNNLVQNPQY